MVTLRPHLTLRPRAAPVERGRMETTAGWWHELGWVPAAGVVGLAVTAVTSWWLELPRGWMVAVYAPVVVTLFAAYLSASRIGVRAVVLRRWRWGVGVGVGVGALRVLTIQRQDGSPRAEGWHLVWDGAWVG